jgi:hypothetical protein
MIKFFRKIRQNLLAENKMGKYMKYAIGEIILVMVGILLALQVSNWNQQRIASQKEELLLEALHNEFIENKAQLERVITKHERSMAHTQFAISHFPIDLETIDLDSLWEGMKHWGGWITFNPSQGVIRSLVNTSSFELISDPELRVLIVSWEDVLTDYQEEEILAVHVLEDFLITEIAENMSWIYGVSDYHFDKNYLNTYAFENAFYRRRSTLRNILGTNDEEGEIVAIKSTIDRIIELSKPEEK